MLVCLISFGGFAQTKLISFKSHSGKKSNFKKTVENNMFDTGRSNFGIVIRHTAYLDTVIYISETKAVLIQRIESDYKSASIRKVDTVSDLQLYKKLSKDNIMLKIQARYHFSKNKKKTILLGFNKK